MALKKHKHVWTTHKCNYYHLAGTRLWLFRICLKCKSFQDAIVDTNALIKWRPYKFNAKEPTK